MFPSITIIAGLESVWLFSSSSKIGGIDSGPSAACAGRIERIVARVIAKKRYRKDIVTF